MFFFIIIIRGGTHYIIDFTYLVDQDDKNTNSNNRIIIELLFQVHLVMIIENRFSYGNNNSTRINKIYDD